MRRIDENVSMRVARGRYLDYRKEGLGHATAVLATADYYGLRAEDLSSELRAYAIEAGFMESRRNRQNY